MRKTAPQLAFKKISGWGGKRRGAGRPNLSGLVSHGKRAVVKKSTPLHLTWRIHDDLVNLRCGESETAFKKAAAGCRKFGLRILHYSIQKDHLHLIAEADDNTALGLGMRSFGTRFGKALREIIGGSGRVFVGRYHLNVLDNPTKMKNALSYVLQNQAKHTRLVRHVDQYSSAPYFGKWKELFGPQMGPVLVDTSKTPPSLPDYLSTPRSWIAREGWMRV